MHIRNPYYDPENLDHDGEKGHNAIFLGLDDKGNPMFTQFNGEVKTLDEIRVKMGQIKVSGTVFSH
jgi:hypothetical protein